MHDRILEIVEKEEVSWKSIMFDLVRGGQIDPWDVDVGKLSQAYIARIRALKQTDLKLSGKVVLASALLLKLKSKRLVGDDLSELDRLLSPTPEPEAGEFYDQLEAELSAGERRAMVEDVELMPKLPQPRKRKVSVFELVRSLERALEVKHRRMLRQRKPEMERPVKKFDVVVAMSNLWDRLVKLAKADDRVPFSQITPGDSKKDKVYTLIPLLHLSNEDKVQLEQKGHFEEIYVVPRDAEKTETKIGAAEGSGATQP